MRDLKHRRDWRALIWPGLSSFQTVAIVITLAEKIHAIRSATEKRLHGAFDL